MTTPILGMDELVASQSQPHLLVNAGLRALEVAAQIRVLDRTNTPPGSPADGDRYLVTATATGAWAGHEDHIAYYSGGWLFLTPESGWIAYVVDEAVHYRFTTVWAEVNLAAYDLGASSLGAPVASQVLMRYPFPRAVSFPASLTGSQGVAGTAATAQTDFDIRKNGSSVGTMRFAAAATVASFIAASAFSFAVGDVITVVAPATPDATLADIGFALKGAR